MILNGFNFIYFSMNILIINKDIFPKKRIINGNINLIVYKLQKEEIFCILVFFIINAMKV